MSAAAKAGDAVRGRRGAAADKDANRERRAVRVLIRSNQMRAGPILLRRTGAKSYCTMEAWKATVCFGNESHKDYGPDESCDRCVGGGGVCRWRVLLAARAGGAFAARAGVGARYRFRRAEGCERAGNRNRRQGSHAAACEGRADERRVEETCCARSGPGSGVAYWGDSGVHRGRRESEQRREPPPANCGAAELRGKKRVAFAGVCAYPESAAHGVRA